MRAARPQPGDGVPELRALPAPHRATRTSPSRCACRKKLSAEEIDRKVREATETLELDEHLERKPGNLSGGQRQRVAMGRAIVRDAKAFLFDEPLSNLDAKLRGQMRTEISRLQQRLGITTVYVTHDQTEAMTLGDRVAVLKRRRAAAARRRRGSCYEQPVNLFVAGFIGSPPMNFMPATGEGRQGGAAVRDGSTCPEHVRDGRIPEDTLLIAGIRPEYFEDASVMDSRRRPTAPRSGRRSTWSSGSGTRRTATSRTRPRPRWSRSWRSWRRSSTRRRFGTQIIVALDSASRIQDGDEAELHVRLEPDAPVRAELGREPHAPEGERRRAGRGGVAARGSYPPSSSARSRRSSGRPGSTDAT